MTEKGVTAVLDVLDKIAQIAKDIPPVDNAASRFGNPAFRTFYDKVSEVRGIYRVQAVCLFKFL
jgi:serine/threonine-protein phosphatase 2A activator